MTAPNISASPSYTPAPLGTLTTAAPSRPSASSPALLASTPKLSSPRPKPPAVSPTPSFEPTPSSF